MAKLTYAQLAAVIEDYVVSNKIAATSFTTSNDNIVGLLDKVGKIITLDTNYVDKLGFMDGEDLMYGKTIEEWNQSLILPTDFDAQGEDNDAPAYPTYAPVSYSYTLGRKKIKVTEPFGNIERSVNSAEQLVSVTSMISKRMFDSEAAMKYQIKREMIAKFIEKIDGVLATSTQFSTSTNYDVGTYLKNGSTSTVGVIVKKYTSGGAASWAAAVSAGYIVELVLEKTITAPTDEATSEAFIKQVKQDVEIASDLNEGNSLNGNSLGATDGLVLVVKQGIIPTLEVEALAGAFHEDRLAVPAEIAVVKDFGGDTSGAYAILMDKRGLRLHNDYRAVRSHENADGDFMNYVLHTEWTAFGSRNTFVKVYKA